MPHPSSIDYFKMQLSIFSIPAIAVLLALAEASPVEIPSIYKRGLDLSLSKSKCGTNENQVSCSNESSSDNIFKHNNGSGSGSGGDPHSCCVEKEGLILQTQFWDYDVPGPETSWTIHGLWPDKCDGSYDANCGFSDSVSSVKDVLENAGEKDLVDYMSQYWKNEGGNDEKLWLHEFNKHGTCMSTLADSCYSGNNSSSSSSNSTATASGSGSNQNVVDWAKLTVKTFQGLPTYKWLSDAGITPSSDKQYEADDIAKALSKGFGNEVYIGCRSGKLNEVWYFHKVEGSLLDDKLIKVDSVSKSTCSGKVQYLPKTSGSN